MRTRMTELLGIKHPIMLSGMNWLTTPKLVAAVSNAGGLGVLATQQYDPERLRNAIKEIRSLTGKPFGVNFTMGVGTDFLIPVAIEEKVPVVNYALGRPPEIGALVEAVHAYGGRVIGTVAFLRHSLRAEQLGVDMLNITGYEAAGHSGNVGALVLIPTITSAVKIPCIGAGGYIDGKSLAAALALGAEGMAMGTRLAATQEAEVPDGIKQAWLKATEEDTVIDTAFDGIPCRVLRNKAAEKMMKKRLPLIDAVSAALFMKREMQLSWTQLYRTANAIRKMQIGIGDQQRGFASSIRIATGSRLVVKATVEGDVDNGLLLMGQGAGRIHDIPTVSELIERSVREAEQILKTLNTRIGS
ncbi:MAG: nitronate monooxygenase [Chloroflexi bacterium]|nr:nitronate monooxygenase [Chloroflexota bacterium]